VGATKVSLELAYDDETIGVDFRLIEPAAFYHTLQHFTGSKDHNIRISQLAKEKGEKVSEYGIETENGELLQYHSEAEIYQHFQCRIGLHLRFVKMVVSLTKTYLDIVQL
jgi:DNA polymerase (family 10)